MFTDVTVGRVCHFVLLGKIDPQLGAEHQLAGLGHLLMDDAAACGHPLAASIVDRALVAHAVPVLDLPFDKVGDRFYATVGVPGKPCQIVLRVGGVESVQHEEGIELLDIVIADYPDQFHTGSVILYGSSCDAFYGFYVHGHSFMFSKNRLPACL